MTTTTREPRRKTISASQLDALSCRLAWHWGYRKGYQSAMPNKNLIFGDAIHKALESHYKGLTDDLPTYFHRNWRSLVDSIERDVKNADMKYISELQRLGDTGRSMLEEYLNEYGGVEDEPFQVVATEKTLQTELGNPTTGELSGYWLTARLDGIIEMRRDGPNWEEGEVFSLEHKTFTQFNYEYLSKDHQISTQIYLGQRVAEEMKLSQPVSGVMYNGLRKAVKTSRTTAAVLQRHIVRRNPRQVEILLHRAFHQANESNQPGFPIYPQPNPIKCGYCDFKEVCQVYTEGGDFNALLKEKFTSRAERNAKR